jgi:hypothetical protein
MLVSDLLEILNRFSPDENICALIYDKSIFDYGDDDDMVLTTDAWNKICKEFDEMPFNDVWESINMACIDYAEIKEVAE